MKSLREIVYSIIEFSSGFQVTDDNPLEPQLIADKVDDVRATLIKQEYVQHRKIDDTYFQRVPVEIVEDDISSDANLVEFKVNFPPVMSNLFWDNIKYLGKKTMKEGYNRRTTNEYSVGNHRRWTHNFVDYTLIGADTALIRNEKVAKDIKIIAIFKSPSKVPGFDWDKPYPTPDPFKLEMIVKQDIYPSLRIPPDEENDARHNSEQIAGAR